MLLRRGEVKIKKDATKWHAWAKESEAQESQKRIFSARKGKAGVCILVDDNGNLNTDERVAEIGAKSFLRRPSMKAQAIRMICSFMNNIVLSTRRPTMDYTYHACALFVFKNKAVWWGSGDVNAVLICDGEPVFVSKPQTYPFLGFSPAYAPKELEEIELKKGEYALFMSAGKAPDNEQIQTICALLKKSQTPQEWLEAVRMEYEDSFSSALSVFLHSPKTKLKVDI